MVKQILGPDGRPVSSKELTEKIALPTVTGVRSVWAETLTGEITPDYVASALQLAARGDNRQYLGLAEEMEEREGHYGSVLGIRKRALAGIEPVVKPASTDRRDEEIADAVRELLDDPALTLAYDDILDGLGKGYSAVEMTWDYGAVWRPVDYTFRDPRIFQFDKLDGRTLRLRSDNSIDGHELTASQRHGFIFHTPRLKSGLPVRNGLARFAMWSFVLKTFTVQDWMSFLEVFGMPLRLGRYDNQAGPEERRVLMRAVRELGTDAAAIVPKGMEIEFIEAKGGQGNAVFGAFADYLDKQISKIVLGQTMTTDNGASLAQAKVHNEVRLDILKADARQLSATLTRDLVKPFVAFNFGPQSRYPQIDFPVSEPEDLEKHATVLEKLVPLGLKVKSAQVRERLGYDAPDEKDEVLTPAMAAPAGSPPKSLARAWRSSACPECGGAHLAAQINEDDSLIDEALSHHERDMEPIVKAILSAASEVDDYDAFLARLETIELDTGGLTARLASLQMKARGRGDQG